MELLQGAKLNRGASLEESHALRQGKPAVHHSTPRPRRREKDGLDTSTTNPARRPSGPYWVERSCWGIDWACGAAQQTAHVENRYRYIDFSSRPDGITSWGGLFCVGFVLVDMRVRNSSSVPGHADESSYFLWQFSPPARSFSFRKCWRSAWLVRVRRPLVIRLRSCW